MRLSPGVCRCEYRWEVLCIGERNKVAVVAEAKWTTAPLSPTIIDDLETYKIPALRQELKVAARPHIVLFSKSGYTAALQALADREAHITLVDVAQALEQARES